MTINNQSTKPHVAIAVSLLVLLAMSSSAFAFKFIPGVHQVITRDALRDKFKLDDNRCLSHINTGLIEQDKVRMMEGKEHCDDNLIEDGLRSAEGNIDKALELAKDSYKDPKKLEDCLKTFGCGLHTLHDFYAHSNYLERAIQAAGAGFSADSLKPFSWKNIKTEMSSGLQTGYYALEETVDTSKASGWDLLSNPLGAISEAFTFDREKVVATCATSFNLSKDDFHSQKEFDDRNKVDAKKPDEHLKAALDYVNDSKKKVLHYELNKDIPDTDEGKVPVAGTNLHALACRLARMETQNRWQAFEDAIRAKCKQPDVYKLILPAVRGQNIPAITMNVHTRPAPDADGRIDGTIGINLHGLIEPMNVDVSARDITPGSAASSATPTTLSNISDGPHSLPLSKVIRIAPPEKGTQCVEISAAFAEDNTFDVQREWLVTQSNDALLGQLRSLFPPGAKEINGKAVPPATPGGALAVSIGQYPGIFMSTLVRFNSLDSATKATKDAPGTTNPVWSPVQGLGEAAWDKLQMKSPNDKRVFASSSYSLEFRRGCCLFVCDTGQIYTNISEAALKAPVKKVAELMDRSLQEQVDREIATVETVLTSSFPHWSKENRLTEANVRSLIQDKSTGPGEFTAISFLWDLFVNHPERLVKLHGTPKDGQSVTLEDLKTLITQMKAAGKPAGTESPPELGKQLRDDFYYACGVCGERTRTVPVRLSN